MAVLGGQGNHDVFSVGGFEVGKHDELTRPPFQTYWLLICQIGTGTFARCCGRLSGNGDSILAYVFILWPNEVQSKRLLRNPQETHHQPQSRTS